MRSLTCHERNFAALVRGQVDLEQLLVFHHSGPMPMARRAAQTPAVHRRSGFRLTTCQRELEILFQPSAKSAVGGEAFHGVDAYRFLLEFATGLRSAIPGETNVFGQLRSAWREYLRENEPREVHGTVALMESLFADTRAIRTAYLQDIGGYSYGTLTRKLLRPTAGARILLVGYGDLARSVLPMLSGFELGLINRTHPIDAPESVQRVFDLTDAEEAIDWSDYVVLCVPRTADLDSRWVKLLASRPRVRAIHLGCRRADLGPWAGVNRLATLDDLFDLRIAQQDRRMRQLELARAACRTRALLRAADVARYQTSATRT